MTKAIELDSGESTEVIFRATRVAYRCGCCHLYKSPPSQKKKKKRKVGEKNRNRKKEIKNNEKVEKARILKLDVLQTYNSSCILNEARSVLLLASVR